MPCAKSIAILGTGSDVGKSLVTAGLCRLFHRAGIRVAPFKAQNMSLNSFVTPEGDEMGRAQVLQAKACGLFPHVDMNPILLKPEGDAKSQVIVQGRVWRSQEASHYFQDRNRLFQIVQMSYHRLASQYDLIVIEGAGSAAEINLRDRDIVNWPVVEMANASVILVADIDRGGVFAQVIGTLDLLHPEERARVTGIVINKFRGDLTLFEDGVTMLEERTGIPVLGVVPFLRSLELDQEDSVEVERFRLTPFEEGTVNVAVVLLPHMSNFTDFNPLWGESDVALRYAATPRELQGADVVIIPGSKTTIADVEYLRKQNFAPALHRHRQRGGEVVGICGGYQMLGLVVNDPHGVETGGSVEGLGMLEISTDLLAEKKMTQVRGRPLGFAQDHEWVIEGYEIHLGKTELAQGVSSCFQCQPIAGTSCSNVASEGEAIFFDGARSRDGLVWGTYLHGVFDRPVFRRSWLNRVRTRKQLPPLDIQISEAVSSRLDGALDRWADHLRSHLALSPIFSGLELNRLASDSLRVVP